MDRQQISHRLNLGHQYVIAFTRSLIGSSAFRQVEGICLFIGNPRSGHTLVGSLIDAHPSALIADELNVLRHLPYSPSREHLFWMIQQNSARAAAGSRERQGYYYEVPNQWQGRFQTLKIIGDKKGGSTAWALATTPGLFERLKNFVRLPIKFIHVIRNPYDNITTMARRRELTDVRPMIDGYFTNIDKTLVIKQLAGAANVLEVRQEALIAEPEKTLGALCQFLNLEPQANYIKDCASIIFRQPSLTRRNAHWEVDAIAEVASRIKKYPMLEGYEFES